MDINKELNTQERKYFELSKKIVEECGLDLYDIEFIAKNSTLRVFIMDLNTKSAQLDDCIKVDRAFSPYCEELEWIPESFVLEVSSPGIYRNLKTLKHFELSVGDTITCTITGDVDFSNLEGIPKKLKKAKKLKGILKEVKQDNIVLDLDGFDLLLDYKKIKKAHLDPDINA